MTTLAKQYENELIEPSLRSLRSFMTFLNKHFTNANDILNITIIPMTKTISYERHFFKDDTHIIAKVFLITIIFVDSSYLQYNHFKALSNDN